MSKSCIFRVQIWKQNQLCKNMRKARKIPHYRLKNLWVLESILVNLQTCDCNLFNFALTSIVFFQ